MTVLSIIIVNYNTGKFISQCLRSIEKHTKDLDYEIIVVDNASSDESVEFLRKQKNRRLKIFFNSRNLGFAKAVNYGIRKSSGKYILLLNPDTKIIDNSLKRMVDFAKESPDAGVVGARLLNPDHSIQPSIFHFPTVWNALRQYWLCKEGLFSKYSLSGTEPVSVDAVVGAAFLITPQALQKAGYLDEHYFMYFEDLDYCRRVKKEGLKVFYLGSAKIVHFHGQSGKNLADQSTQWRRLVPSSKIYHGRLRHYLINFIIRSSNIFGRLKNIFSNNKKLLAITVLLIIISPTFLPLFAKGYFYMQDDLQAFRIQQMDKCFQDFQIPCRWVPDAGYGYGYPQFNYYPPFVYYFGELIHFLGFQFVDSVKILFILGYILSALAMFVLINSLAGVFPALIGSIVYTYAPYKAVEVYVRGALSEFWSFVFFPFIFWSSYLLIKTGKKSYFVLFSLFLAFLLTTHILMTIAFLVPLAS